MVKIGRIHRRAAGMWMTDRIHFERFSATLNDWEPVGSTICNIQRPSSTFSREDARWANTEEKDRFYIYTPTNCTMKAGDRFHWNNQVYTINAGGSIRSDDPYTRYQASASQTAVIEELITFTRPIAREDGTIIGYHQIGAFKCHVTKSFDAIIPNIMTDNTAVSSITSGSMLAELSASVLTVGDRFVYRGFPGHVTAVDTSDPDHIEIRFRVETGAA